MFVLRFLGKSIPHHHEVLKHFQIFILTNLFGAATKQNDFIKAVAAHIVL